MYFCAQRGCAIVHDELSPDDAHPACPICGNPLHDDGAEVSQAKLPEQPVIGEDGLPIPALATSDPAGHQQAIADWLGEDAGEDKDPVQEF